MEQLEQILREHSLRYREIQPADAVKLIYQNEFGGGHLIRDEEGCLTYLRQEYAGVEKTAEGPIIEPIGNGIVRVYLSGLTPAQLEELGQAFLESAREHKGTMKSFHNKLRVLEKLTEQGVFGFDRLQLQTYLQEYAELGYPAVSHSQVYRNRYKPAYRVVKIQYMTG